MICFTTLIMLFKKKKNLDNQKNVRIIMNNIKNGVAFCHGEVSWCTRVSGGMDID